MNRYISSWLAPRWQASFTSTRWNRMEAVAWQASGTSSRASRQMVASLVVYGSDDEPFEPAEPHMVPTPTDVPVPEPMDVPVPEPMDVPPPTPRDTPPPKPRPVP